MNEETTSPLQSEFSRPIDIATLPQSGRGFKIEATPEEEAALAERFGVIAVENLKSECVLKPVRGQKAVRFQLDASFSARVVQACSVTLEPVPEDVAGSFTVYFVDEDFDELVERQEIEFAYDEEDIEPLIGQVIDLGEQLAQHLSLSMNPYPRKQGAKGDELGYEILQEDDETLVAEKKNPFEVLKTLKHKS
ncbi:YceD family protein [Emcibacter sp.]|uniref:YceD family protein n=1 Tax=Emcibacter sp. TaxID=1979954 RepID=UPI003A8CD060